MRKANIIDLKLELWLRQRNSGSICWTTKDEQTIPIKDMSHNHLVNTLKMFIKQEEEEGFMREHIGDMSPMDYYD